MEFWSWAAGVVFFPFDHINKGITYRRRVFDNPSYTSCKKKKTNPLVSLIEVYESHMSHEIMKLKHVCRLSNVLRVGVYYVFHCFGSTDMLLTYHA